MDRLTRKELKRDAFAQEVGQTVEYVEQHRKQVLVYGSIALVLILSVAAYRWYSRRQHEARQRQLHQAMRVLDAAIGPPSPGGRILTFPTQEARGTAAVKALTDLVANHGGSDEGIVARYFLATVQADQGKLEEAEKSYRLVVEEGEEPYVSLAKFALAQVCHARGNTAEGEKLLRLLIEKPTGLVSKEQATITLAQMLASSRPEEARKLLEPLRTQPGAVSRTALTAIGSLPQK